MNYSKWSCCYQFCLRFKCSLAHCLNLSLSVLPWHSVTIVCCYGLFFIVTYGIKHRGMCWSTFIVVWWPLRTVCTEFGEGRGGGVEVKRRRFACWQSFHMDVCENYLSLSAASAAITPNRWTLKKTVQTMYSVSTRFTAIRWSNVFTHSLDSFPMFPKREGSSIMPKFVSCFKLENLEWLSEIKVSFLIDARCPEWCSLRPKTATNRCFYSSAHQNFNFSSINPLADPIQNNSK